MMRLSKCARGLFVSFRKLNVAFAIARRGNIAVFTAFIAIPLFMLLGSSVDFARREVALSTLQAAVDAGVLTAASVANTVDMEKAARNFVLSNLPDGSPWDTFDDDNIEILENESGGGTRLLRLRANVSIPTYFLPLINIDELAVTVEGEAQQTIFSSEVTLVLDISNSMKTGGKMGALRTAAVKFIDTVFANSVLNNTSVSIVPYGGNVNIAPIFDRHAIPVSKAKLDPGTKQYQLYDKIPDGDFRFSWGSHCIELRSSDYSDALLPFHNRSQIPHFWVNATNAPWCPPDESAVLLNSKDADALKARVGEMDFSFGTGTDVAVAYAQYTLSPQWRGMLGGDFFDRPADYSDTATRKFMILMSDGEITAQFRPLDILEREADSDNQQFLYKAIPDAADKLSNLCTEMKMNNIRIFTIGFDVKSPSSIEERLKDCASSDSDYFPANTKNLEDVFQGIASFIGDLYISG